MLQPKSHPDSRRGAYCAVCPSVEFIAWSLFCLFGVTQFTAVVCAKETKRTDSPIAPVEADADASTDRSTKLVVCAVSSSMPRTGKAEDGSPTGVDLETARLVSKQLGRKLEVHWCSKGSCHWNDLAAKYCDLVVGVPHGSGPRQGVDWSSSYSGSRFGLVVAKQSRGIHSLGDLQGKKIGVVAGTVSLSTKDHKVLQFPTREALLRQFGSRGLDAALLDADFVTWYLPRQKNLSLKLVSEFVPRERWNSAFAVRSSDRELLDEVNRALHHLMAKGEISKAFTRVGVAYRAPYKTKQTLKVVEDSWPEIREQGEIVVAMDPANLPYSSAKESLSGFDVEIARLVAQELGVKLKIDWLDIHRETAIGALIEGDCDLAFGAPIDPNAMDDDTSLAGKISYSKPYYGTGFVLVTRTDTPPIKKLSELKGKNSNRIGTEAGTVADYTLRQRGYHRRLFRTQLSVLKSIHDRGIDYGYLWANVGWTLHKSPDFDLGIVPDYQLEDHWNVSIALRHGDMQLKQQLDAAIKRIVDRGEVALAMARYHVPHFAPVAPKQPKKEKPTPAKATSNQPPAAVRQKSKHSYTTLQRIRDRGVLTVGLDQGNLPFSSANPEPAGLDYEIAGLLAKELGVDRKIYWAYSSHDSYPSKLARKNFCDIVLGVMRDDRFSDRVIYTKPYYVASYQLVVPSKKGTQANWKQFDNETLAVEPGLVIHGLSHRKTKPLGGLEEILAAVVQSKVAAGYVISTRAHWLAEKRWPGQLRFLSPPTEDDQLEIRAAVRKSDATLQSAVNQAFDNLATSGELAKVFDRWDIPYKMMQPREETSE